MSLKTRDFSRETEALKFDGGGENRTLVLNNLPTNDYMLIVLLSDDSRGKREDTLRTKVSHSIS